MFEREQPLLQAEPKVRIPGHDVTDPSKYSELILDPEGLVLAPLLVA